MIGIPPQNLHNILFPYAPYSFSARNAERVKLINIIFMELLETVSGIFHKSINSNGMTPCVFNLLLIHLLKTR